MLLATVQKTDTADMPTSGNTNLYFEAHKPVFFKNIHITALLRCFAVAMCCAMSYLPLAAMLKSAEHNVHLAWFSPFLDGFMKSPAARILLLESLFSFIFGRHHTYKLHKISW